MAVDLYVKYGTCVYTLLTCIYSTAALIQAEMSSLLCQFSVVGADAAHIRRLEVALRQAQTEKETLLTKLHKIEKQQVRNGGLWACTCMCVCVCLCACTYFCFDQFSLT